MSLSEQTKGKYKIVVDEIRNKVRIKFQMDNVNAGDMLAAPISQRGMIGRLIPTVDMSFVDDADIPDLPNTTNKPPIKEKIADLYELLCFTSPEVGMGLNVVIKKWDEPRRVFLAEGSSNMKHVGIMEVTGGDKTPKSYTIEDGELLTTKVTTEGRIKAKEMESYFPQEITDIINDEEVAIVSDHEDDDVPNLINNYNPGVGN